MKRLAAAGVLLVAAGCSPSSYRECMSEAAGKPTDTGVRVAAAQCYQRFTAEARAQQANPFDRFDEFLAADERPVPAWLAQLDAAVAGFDRALGLPWRPDRGAHVLRRMVQLLVIVTMAGAIWYWWRRRRRP